MTTLSAAVFTSRLLVVEDDDSIRDTVGEGCHVQQGGNNSILQGCPSGEARTAASLKQLILIRGSEITRSEEFVEVVEINGLELALFHLLHQALELGEQGSTRQQRQQQGHQKSGT